MPRKAKLIVALICYAIAALCLVTTVRGQHVGDGEFDDLFVYGVCYIGDDTDTDYYLYVDNGDANNPYIMYDAGENEWRLANDGTTPISMGDCADKTCIFDVLDWWQHGPIELPLSSLTQNAAIYYSDLNDSINVYNGSGFDTWSVSYTHLRAHET